MDDDLRSRAEAIARRHGSAVVASLGAGEDHVAFTLAGEVVLRLRRDGGAEGVDGADGVGAVEREARLLALVAGVSPVPTPEVVFVDAAEGALAVRALPGTSLLDRPCPDPGVLVASLADLIGAVHAVPLDDVAALVPTDPASPDEHLAEAQDCYRQVHEAIPTPVRPAVERFLAAPPPRAAPLVVLCHADLGAEHLLAEADPWRLTGVIDWSDAAVTDPALDLARLHRDLGPAVAAQVAARLHHLDPGALARAAFYARCALLEDLAYGLETGDRRYADAALVNLGHTFEDVARDTSAPGPAMGDH